MTSRIATVPGAADMALAHLRALVGIARRSVPVAARVRHPAPVWAVVGRADVVEPCRLGVGLASVAAGGDAVARYRPDGFGHKGGTRHGGRRAGQGATAAGPCR